MDKDKKDEAIKYIRSIYNSPDGYKLDLFMRMLTHYDEYITTNDMAEVNRLIGIQNLYKRFVKIMNKKED